MSFRNADDLINELSYEAYEHMSGSSRIMARDHATGKLFYIQRVWTERHDDADGSHTTWVDLEEA